MTHREILVVLSDTHAGFSLALMNPDVELFDEDEFGEQEPYKPKMTASQEYLWEIYTSMVKKITKFANGDPIHIMHNGDLTQGSKHKTNLVSDRDADQVLIGVANLIPLMEMPNVKSLRMSVGTEAHTFDMGSSEMLAAKLLQTSYPKLDIKITYHGLMRFGNVVVDYAHHGGHPGTRLWLSGNVQRLYLRDLMLNEIVAGRKPPRLIFRGHFHQYQRIDEQIGEYESTLIMTPSFSMLNDYAKQATRSAFMLTHGMVANEIVDGELGRIMPLLKTKDIRLKEDMCPSQKKSPRHSKTA